VGGRDRPRRSTGSPPLAGSAADVGVAGYTLGGGLSWLGRRYGLASNHVTAIELVTADGRLVRADAEHEADLFWALRGGEAAILAIPTCLRRFVRSSPNSTSSHRLPPAGLLEIHNDPKQPSAGMSDHRMLSGAPAEAIDAALVGLMDALAPWDAGRAIPTFTDKPAPAGRFHDEYTLLRLRSIKARVDGDDLFVANHPSR
jgi:hypothetical protein